MYLFNKRGEKNYLGKMYALSYIELFYFFPPSIIIVIKSQNEKLFFTISQFVTCFNKILRIFRKEEKRLTSR